MNDRAEIVKTVSREYPLLFPQPGWSEQNPDDWWNAVCEGVKELTDGFDKTAVKSIGVGGQMNGLVMLDGDDNMLRPAILWNDTRTGSETDYLNNVIGKEKLQALTGNIAFAGFTAPKLIWVKKNEPEIFARCQKICLPKDYINYKLTGAFATDVSDASGTLYFDVENCRWSAEMLDILGIEDSCLPKVYCRFRTKSINQTGKILKQKTEKSSRKNARNRRCRKPLPHKALWQLTKIFAYDGYFGSVFCRKNDA